MSIKRSMSRPATKVKRLAKRRAAVAVNSYAPRLLAWYDQHRRLLPWRALPNQDANPYYVWLSEIMLQQTTVATVGPYFQKFIARWPTLDALAGATLDDILVMWAGLGYYRRAAMLHKCAHVIKKAGGVFPKTFLELRELPGFGPYTAAAVAAIAFGQKTTVVDGNVERVIARIFALTTPLPAVKKEIRIAAESLVPDARPGDYAQALMDLGATICTPRDPKCTVCPWQTLCSAHKKGIAKTLPRRVERRAKSVRRTVAFVVFNRKGEIYLRRRPPHGLLGRMMEVPSTDWREGAFPDAKTWNRVAPLKTTWRLVPGLVEHVFTHFTLEATIAVGQGEKVGKSGIFVSVNQLDHIALPRVMHKMIHHAYRHAL